MQHESGLDRRVSDTGGLHQKTQPWCKRILKVFSNSYADLGMIPETPNTKYLVMTYQAGM